MVHRAEDTVGLPERHAGHALNQAQAVRRTVMPATPPIPFSSVAPLSVGEGSRTPLMTSIPGGELPTERTTGSHGDGAFMEPSRRNHWQSAANRRTAKPAETSHIRCRAVAPRCLRRQMVRRGSTVRVRQRALQKPSKRALSLRRDPLSSRESLSPRPVPSVPGGCRIWREQGPTAARSTSITRRADPPPRVAPAPS